MKRYYLDPPLCVHEFPVGVLRSGEPRCPMCRREKAAAAHRSMPIPKVDRAALAAGDDTLWKDDPR